MNCIFEKVLERDIDLLMINKFINDERLLSFFLSKIKLYGYSIVKIEHSYMDAELGESDITVIVEKDNHKIGLLIENKIDAIAMDLQPERYKKRGDKGISNHLYDEYDVFIIAPQKYLDTNEQVKKYPNKVSYEELLNLLSDDIYSASLLKKAIEEKESGYTVIENEMVTNFWSRYYDFIRRYYPKIKIHEIEGPRGSKAAWPEMNTDYKQIVIMHKSDRGYMDLTFGKMASHISIFNKYVDKFITEDLKVIETGKSLSIRIEVPIIDFREEFDNYISEMHECMKSALRLYDLLSKINVLMMYEEIKNYY